MSDARIPDLVHSNLFFRDHAVRDYCYEVECLMLGDRTLCIEICFSSAVGSESDHAVRDYSYEVECLTLGGRTWCIEICFLVSSL